MSDDNVIPEVFSRIPDSITVHRTPEEGVEDRDIYEDEERMVRCFRDCLRRGDDDMFIVGLFALERAAVRGLARLAGHLAKSSSSAPRGAADAADPTPPGAGEQAARSPSDLDQPSETTEAQAASPLRPEMNPQDPSNAA